jgi:hypothetical protein
MIKQNLLSFLWFQISHVLIIRLLVRRVVLMLNPIISCGLFVGIGSLLISGLLDHFWICYSVNLFKSVICNRAKHSSVIYSVIEKGVLIRSLFVSVGIQRFSHGVSVVQSNDPLFYSRLVIGSIDWLVVLVNWFLVIEIALQSPWILLVFIAVLLRWSSDVTLV